jgi:hypothetical protein
MAKLDAESCVRKILITLRSRFLDMPRDVP